MDSRIVELGDPIADATIFHDRCRGLWVEIMQEEVNKPDITGVPKALRQRFKGFSNIDQPSKPIYIKPDTPADDFLKGEK